MENLKYLTISQALEDVATLIRFLKANATYFGASKVFLVGGSYTGFLVPWFAKLYPELIDLGWGSSAPFEFKADFKGYYENVFNIIEQIGGSKCHKEIIKGFKSIDSQYTENGDYIFRSEPCEEHWRKQIAFERFTGIFASLVQFEE